MGAHTGGACGDWPQTGVSQAPMPRGAYFKAEDRSLKHRGSLRDEKNTTKLPAPLTIIAAAVLSQDLSLVSHARSPWVRVWVSRRETARYGASGRMTEERGGWMMSYSVGSRRACYTASTATPPPPLPTPLTTSNPAYLIGFSCLCAGSGPAVGRGRVASSRGWPAVNA